MSYGASLGTQGLALWAGRHSAHSVAIRHALVLGPATSTPAHERTRGGEQLCTRAALPPTRAGQERIKPSLLWRVAQWRKDPRDGSIDIGVWWSNK